MKKYHCMLIFLAALPLAVMGDMCRMGPASHEGCALPNTLGNFQSMYQCNPAVKIGKPKNLEEAQTIVTLFDRVKANGVGHSWWMQQFCSGSNDTDINIVMTEFNDTLSFILNPTNPKAFNGQQPPANFPIQVDEEKGEVTVAAGITQRMLLDYLSDYKYGKEPNGWTLEAFSWFIDQTIGGAVATGTHGSTFQHGSLSSQVLSLRLLLANGTIINLTPENNPHLFKAAAVSVGRLGIITDITFKIIPQRSVKRELQDINITKFASEVKAVQDEFNSAKANGDKMGEKLALSKLDETQALWFVLNKDVWRTDYQYLNKEPQSVLVNLPLRTTVSAFDGPAQGVYNSQPTSPMKKNNMILSNPRLWSNIYATTMRGYVTPGTYAAHKAYISMSEAGTIESSTLDPYNQYEVAIPFEKAGDCLTKVNEMIYGPENLWEGFRTPALIRFVSGEPFYISPSNGGPVMYVNVEDHLSISSGRPNTKFSKVIDFFINQCDARFHWGKAGWPEHEKCFDGAVTYPDTWCDFGCAVQELDPQGKFRSESDVWRWGASSVNGSDVEFSSCCSASGFNKDACKCKPVPIC